MIKLGKELFRRYENFQYLIGMPKLRDKQLLIYFLQYKKYRYLKVFHIDLELPDFLGNN